MRTDLASVTSHRRMHVVIAGLAIVGVAHLIDMSSALVGLAVPDSVSGAITTGGVLLTVFGLANIATRLPQTRLVSSRDSEPADGTAASDINVPTALRSQRNFGHLLRAECARAIRYGSDLAVLMIDVDDFKQINESEGPTVGDEAIRQLYCLIQRLVRNLDSVCRHAGAEFYILLPQTDIDGAMRLAERIRGEILSGAMFYGPLSVHMTVSIGAYSPTSHDDIEPRTVLRRVESALREAKATGKNRVVAYRSVDASDAEADDGSLQPMRAR